MSTQSGNMAGLLLNANAGIIFKGSSRCLQQSTLALDALRGHKSSARSGGAGQRVHQILHSEGHAVQSRQGLASLVPASGFDNLK